MDEAEWLDSTIDYSYALKEGARWIPNGYPIACAAILANRAGFIDGW